MPLAHLNLNSALLRAFGFAAATMLLVLSVTLSANASQFREFHIDSRYGGISDIAKGPDGNVWFTNFGIGRISPSGVSSQITLGLSSNADVLTTGADGNVWFLEQHKVGKITPAGRVTEYDVRSTYPYFFLTPSYGITLGPDGNVWFTEYWNRRIGRVTPRGVVTEFAIPGNGYNNPTGIVAGRDGNLWFGQNNGLIGRLNPLTGKFLSSVSVPGNPFKLTIGADGNIWFDQSIGRITYAGAVRMFPDPSGYGFGLASARDGNIWIVDWANDSFDRINPRTGQYLAPLHPPTAYSGLDKMTIGPDGNVWFTENNKNNIGVYRF